MNIISYTNAGKRQHGDNHWFWAVWINADETPDRSWNKSDPTESGFCPCKSQARQAAWAALKALGHRSAYDRGWARALLWNQRIDDNRPVFSRCKVGKAKWLWVVFSTCFGYDDEPLAHGFADSPHAALEEAERACGSVKQAGNYLVNGFRERQSAMKRKTQSAQTNDTAPLEFVYECHPSYSDYDGERYDSINPYRIVKKTKKRIYVEKDPYREKAKQTGEWWDYVESTFILDRDQFEKTGKVRRAGRSYYGTFYSDPEIYYAERRSTAHRPDCFVGLGVPAGASIAEVQAAYRNLARTTHPDVGGNSEEFKKVQTWFEQAVTLAK